MHPCRQNNRTYATHFRKDSNKRFASPPSYFYISDITRTEG
jgi:hypothetical protein